MAESYDVVVLGSGPKAPKGARAGLILAERKVSVAEPDREANKYLIDRILGRPRQAVEMSGPEGNPVPMSFEKAIERVYGGDDDDDETGTGAGEDGR